MATNPLTTPGGGYATADKETEARLIAMKAKNASPDSQTQTLAVSKLTPDVVVGGATNADGTQFQALTRTPGRYNTDGSLMGAVPGGVAAPGTNPVTGALINPPAPSAVGLGTGTIGADGRATMDPSYANTPDSMLTADQYNAKYGPKPVDEESIRERIRRENQAQVDAINAIYNQQVGDQAIVNEGNLGSTRSINARSGLLGSDFGNTNMKNQQREGERAIGAINAERSLQIQGVYKEISKLAADEIASKKAEALGQADAYKNYLKDAQAKAREAAQILGTSGLSFDELKTQNPEAIQNIIKAGGYDEFTLAQVLNNAKKASEKIDYTYKTVGNKVIGYGLNPKTGAIETVEKSLPVAEGTDLQEYNTQTLADGTLLFTPKTIDPTKPLKDQVLMYGTEGQFAKDGAADGYKFVSATKYQQAGYFNPETGEFKDLTGKKVTNLAPRGGSGGGSGGLTKTEIKEAADAETRATIASDMERVRGNLPDGDRYYNTAEFDKIRKRVSVSDPKTLEWFDKTYPAATSLNPNDPTAFQYLAK